MNLTELILKQEDLKDDLKYFNSKLITYIKLLKSSEMSLASEESKKSFFNEINEYIIGLVSIEQYELYKQNIILLRELVEERKETIKSTKKIIKKTEKQIEKNFLEMTGLLNKNKQLTKEKVNKI